MSERVVASGGRRLDWRNGGGMKMRQTDTMSCHEKYLPNL